MSSMLEYKGYHASVEYDAEDNIFVGEVFGITDSLNFHGSSVEELKEIIDYAHVPFIVKGIMSVEGAQKAVDAGAKAIVVSNHGGRVLDGTPATACVLEEIADQFKGQVKIIVDGGIRSGLDVFKALALGADAVIIARPFVNMIYGGKDEGVEAYVQQLGQELENTMMMTGVSSLREISKKNIYK